MKTVIMTCALLLGSTSVFAQMREAVEAPAGALAQTDVDFLRTVDSANIDQLTLGKRASGRAKDGGVRSLADNVVKSHTKADQALRLLAAAKHVSLDHKMTARGDDEASQLIRRDVPAEKIYVEGVVRDGDELIALFQSGLNSQDPDIRKYADTMLPAVKDYRRQADDLLKRANVKN